MILVHSAALGVAEWCIETVLLSHKKVQVREFYASNLDGEEMKALKMMFSIKPTPTNR